MKFSVILADPPWQFRDTGSRMAPSHAGTGRAYSHYAVLPTDDLRDAGPIVQSLAADDAFLFLWAPHALVLDGQAQAVAKAWGFVPKQEIVWVKTTADGKPRIGGGHYTRICTEPMLLCRRGKARVIRRDIPNVIFAPRSKHSVKPDESYDLIEQITGADRFVELYARRQYNERWTAWGDQCTSTELQSFAS